MLLQAQWLTVLSSNDSSLGATITHIDIEDDADQASMPLLERCPPNLPPTTAISHTAG